MFSSHHLLSTTFVLAILFSCITAEPSNSERREAENVIDTETFQKLLDQVDPPALHAALHDFSPKKFKHGMFPEDRTAVEAIHKDEPKIATGILHMANLAKRQDISNGTVATSTSQAGSTTDSSSPEPASTRVTPVPQGPESSMSASPAGSESSSAPAENSPVVTSSPSTSSDESLTSSAAEAGSSSSAGSPTETSSPSSSSLTAGEAITTTNSIGLIVVSTVGGGVSTISPSGSGQSSPITTHVGSSKTSTLVQTSTLPNGSKSIITAVTVIPAGTTGETTPSGTAGVASTGTSSGSPGLQTGEAAMTRGLGLEMVLVLGGAVGFAMLM